MTITKMHNNKILFLSLYTYSFTGGIEKVCRIFNQVLEQLKLSNFNLSLHDHPAKKNNYQAFGSKKINFALKAIKEGLQADIIILSHINLLLFAKLIRKINPKKRIILFAHGIEIWNDLPAWKKDFLNEIEILAVSNFTAVQIEQKHQVKRENIKVLNNCLESNFDYPNSKIKPLNLMSKYGLNSTTKILLTVCRLSSSEQYKGYDMVLLALKDLIKIKPDIKYFIVGKADVLEKSRMENLINQYQLQNQVILTDYVSDAELKDFYQLADIFAMPSKGEGFGLVFLEAVANGCKVLAGNADGSIDALLNGKLGQIIDPQSAEEVYQGLIKLLNEPSTTDNFNQKQKLLKDHFGFEVYKDKVEKLLLSV